MTLAKRTPTVVSDLTPEEMTSALLPRILLWTALPLLSWQIMQLSHEAGHVLGAWISAGKVVDVDLHPLRMSHTFVQPNPSPKFVIWMGPIIGVLLPVIVWLTLRKCRSKMAPIARFVAGFCCIANGVYLGSILVKSVGDARDLERLHVPAWQMAIFAFIAVPLGFAIWNGSGANLGYGQRSRAVSLFEGVSIGSLVFIIAVIELLCFQ